MARTKPRTGTIDPTTTGTTMGKAVTPEQVAASGTEHGHQAAIFQWVALSGRVKYPELWTLFAIPNGGDRRASVAASLKAEGVKSGVPDMMLPLPAFGRPGLWIELKTPERQGRKDGGRSVDQIEWHKALVAEGYVVVLAFGWQAACWALHLYLGGGLCGQTTQRDENGVIWATACDGPPF